MVASRFLFNYLALLLLLDRFCSTETSIQCESFEWCFSDRVCHLHSERYLDVVDGGNYLTGTSCIHFSSTSSRIHHRFGYHFCSPATLSLSLSHCSICSSYVSVCITFSVYRVLWAVSFSSSVQFSLFLSHIHHIHLLSQNILICPVC